MTEPTRSADLLADPAALGMTRHPEGGWYRETYRSPQPVQTPRGPRASATSVSFLLLPSEVSAWHRVASDELWLWQGGGPLRLTVGGAGDKPERPQSIELGPGGQYLVPAGVWQTAAPAERRAVIVGCLVTPGF
ncbi:MAG TPA: cupin domain-containing protein, partial [Jatrophihabitans sp.]|nr:cupin domain-containing protein [Jatrophihabitans sp.]